MENKADSIDITGSWQKLTKVPCAEKYPEKIEFKRNGIYFGQASPHSTLHTLWDAGTFRLEDNSLRMSTSNDAVIRYGVEIKEHKLCIKDKEDCLVEYVKKH